MSPDARQPQPPPEAVLIRRARKARGLTVQEAASKVRLIKASRWTQIESGYVLKAGEPLPTAASDETLAHMAHVVGVSPEALTETGRAEAAEILSLIDRGRTSDLFADWAAYLRDTSVPLAERQRAAKVALAAYPYLLAGQEPPATIVADAERGNRLDSA